MESYRAYTRKQARVSTIPYNFLRKENHASQMATTHAHRVIAREVSFEHFGALLA